MSDQITGFFVSHFEGIMPSEIIILIISLMPVLELRAGLIAAKLLGVSFFKAFAICYVGNMLPIPFILLFIRYIFNLLKKSRFLKNKIERIEDRYIKKGRSVQRYSFWGLFALVAIPLPGTGAWTGAVVATLLDMRLKRSLPAIALGVFTAGIIISAISYGLLGFIF